MAFLPDAQVGGWSTSATDRIIEVWHTPYGGVTANTGDQYAEINANQSSTLYQDVATTPGQVLRWGLAHRGRAGVDTMAVLMGAPTGVLVTQATLSDGTSAWGKYSGLYVVPVGQTVTRFAFRSISTATGNQTIGNFMDSVSFGTSACLVATASVVNTSGAATANVGDILTYTVTARNDGGNPAQATSLVNTIPAGTVFVPGSITATTDTSSIALTDAAGDDAGGYDASTKTVTVRAGTGATATVGGVIDPAASRSMSYQVRVTSAAAATTVSNVATATFTDALSATRLTATSNTVTTPVAAAADLAVTQSLDTPLLAGTAAQYTVTLTNNHGPQADTGVTLTTTLPPLSGITATGNGLACSISGATLTCSAPSLGVDATASAVIRGTVPSTTAEGTGYTLASHATGALFDPDTSNNTASTSTPTTASADLSVAMTRSPSTPVAGTDVTYGITVTNAGPSAARRVVVTDPIAPGDTFVSATASAGSCSLVNGSVACTDALLAAGDSITISIVVTLAPDSADGAVTNTARVSAQTPDADATNNIDQVSYNSVANADLTVTIDLHATSAYPGDVVGYDLWVKNTGPSDASNVSIATVLPRGVAILTRNGDGICSSSGCTIASIPAGATEHIWGNGQVLSTADAGLVQATTTAISSTPDLTPADNSDTAGLTVVLKADLGVTQSFASPVVAGAAAAETITVHNDGPTRAESIIVTLPISGYDAVPTADGADCAVVGTQLQCSLASLDAGADWTIDIHVQIPASGYGRGIVASSTVSSSTDDTNLDNNTASTTLWAQQRSDVGVSVTTGTPTVMQSAAVHYTITVSNHGPSDASNVLVKDNPRPGILVSGGAASAGTYDMASGTWTIPALAVGDTQTLTIDATAQSAGTLASDVEVLDAAGTDPDAANDSATVEITVTPAARSLTVSTIPTVAPVAHRHTAVVGDVISYEYLVTNTGDVAMSQVAVADSLVDAVQCPQTTLQAGASETCTNSMTYRVTQADFDGGAGVHNVATVSGIGPNSTERLSFAPADSTVEMAAASPALGAIMIADFRDTNADRHLEAGEIIQWTIHLSNNGDVTLNDIAVDDPIAGVVTCPVTRLAPGDAVNCTVAPYTVTAADVLAGFTTNTATATAISPRGGAVVSSDSVSATSPSTDAPAVAVTTNGAVANSASTVAAFNDGIRWTYAVTNTGNVPLTRIAVANGRTAPVTCATTTLAPGVSVTCVAVSLLPVTEADVLAGSISEVATASAAGPTGATIASAPSTGVVGVAGVSSRISISTTILNLTSPAASSRVVKGDTLHANYRLVNRGNVTLHDIVVTDVKFGATACAVGDLAPGATTTCWTGHNYVVTPVDAAVGIVSSTAMAVGTPPAGSGASAAQGVDHRTVAVDTAAVPSATGDGSALAHTGTDPSAPLAIAFLLLALGGVFLFVLGRRRHDPRHRATTRA